MPEKVFKTADNRFWQSNRERMRVNRGRGYGLKRPCKY